MTVAGSFFIFYFLGYSMANWYEAIDDKLQWHDFFNPVGMAAFLGRSSAKAANNFVGSLTGDNQRLNQALERQAAQTAMDFEQSSADKAMKFEADQAQIQRDWYNNLSSTAHQREVSDLRAAGLNPILSANAGAASAATGVASGFSGNGHQANVDTYNQTIGLIGALSGLMSSASRLSRGR